MKLIIIMKTKIKHLTTRIDFLLKWSNKYLKDLFGYDGKEVRKDLIELKSKGHKLIPSEGCMCGED